MTIAGVLAAIAGLGAIVTGVVYLVKLGFFAISKSAEQKKEEIDQDVDDREHQTEEDGRPH
jgi:hypothetical protein